MDGWIGAWMAFKDTFQVILLLSLFGKRLYNGCLIGAGGQNHRIVSAGQMVCGICWNEGLKGGTKWGSSWDKRLEEKKVQLRNATRVISKGGFTRFRGRDSGKGWTLGPVGA
jgi:hypothetical protein